jgi:hypothetical protein
MRSTRFNFRRKTLYGSCPVCGKRLAVRKDGTLRKHNSVHSRGGKYAVIKSTKCPGTGVKIAKPEEG